MKRAIRWTGRTGRAPLGSFVALALLLGLTGLGPRGSRPDVSLAAPAGAGSDIDKDAAARALSPSRNDQTSASSALRLLHRYRPEGVAGAFGYGMAGGVAVGPDGSSYVMDLADHRILEFDPEGDFERSWGGLGEAEGRFDFRNPDGLARNIPAAMGIDVARDGTVYVAELANHRVQRFTAEGRLLGVWGSYGETAAQLRSPVALDIGVDGSVWVNDFDNRRFKRFSPEGRLLASWTPPLDRPLGFTVAASGLIYVAEASLDRPAIVVLTAEGAEIARWPMPVEGEGRGAQAPIPVDLDLSDRGSLMALVWRGQRAVLRIDALTGSRLSAWGGPVSADGRYAGLVSLALSPDDTVFLPDPARRWLARYSLAGHYRGQTENRASLAIGRLSAPAGLAPEAEGGVWVADRGNDRVQRFDVLGRFELELGGPDSLDPQAMLSNPIDLAIGPDGRLFVADTGHSRIVAYDVDGRLSGIWRGDDLDRLSHPEGVAVGPDGRVYIADTGKHRIQVIEADGQMGEGWGAFGPGPGQLDSPHGLSLDPAGNLRVVDTGNHRVQIFSPDGTLRQILGFHGSVDGQFRDARDLAVGPDGRMWVADNLLHRLQRFDAAGRALLGWGFEGWNPAQPGRMEAPEGVAIAPDGGVWVADAALDRVQRLDAQGRSLRRLGNSASSYVPGAPIIFSPEARLDGLRALLAGSDGRLFAILGLDAQRVEMLTPEGRYAGSWAFEGKGPADQPLEADGAWAMGPQGQLHVLDHDGERYRILQLTPEGQWTGEWPLSGPIASSVLLTVAPDRSVYLLHVASSRAFVQRYRHDGKLLSSWPVEGPTGGLSAIAVAPSGEVYIARGYSIERYGPDGGLRGRWGEQGRGPGQMGGECEGCRLSLQIGPDERVYVGDWGNQRIHRFSLDGRFVDAFGPDHRSEGPPWDFPGHFVVLPDGRVVLQGYGVGLGVYGATPPEGWRASYYGNRWLAERPLELDQVENLSFDWRLESPRPGSLPRDGFSARFERWQKPAPGLQTLEVRAEGGLRLWVDDSLEIDAWDGPTVEVDLPLLSDGSWQHIEIEYQDPGGAASLRVEPREP